MLLNQDQDLLADLSVAICSSYPKYNFDFWPHTVSIVREVQEARQLKLVVEMNENDPKKIENQRLPMAQVPSKAPS